MRGLCGESERGASQQLCARAGPCNSAHGCGPATLLRGCCYVDRRSSPHGSDGRSRAAASKREVSRHCRRRRLSSLLRLSPLSCVCAAACACLVRSCVHLADEARLDLVHHLQELERHEDHHRLAPRHVDLLRRHNVQLAQLGLEVVAVGLEVAERLRDFKKRELELKRSEKSSRQRGQRGQLSSAAERRRAGLLPAPRPSRRAQHPGPSPFVSSWRRTWPLRELGKGGGQARVSDRAEAEQERGDVEADCIRVSATRPYATGATHYVTQEKAH